MFGATGLVSRGRAANVEVFAVQDKEFGPLVGPVFNGADDDQRLSIRPQDALLLAEILETKSREATLELASARKQWT